mgnify:CR=1 FL=1
MLFPIIELNIIGYFDDILNDALAMMLSLIRFFLIRIFTEEKITT